MSERFLIDQLDEAVEAITTRGEKAPVVDPRLADLLRIAADLRDLPRAEFKAQLKAELTRRGSMSSSKMKVEPIREGFHTITPYLTVERAERLLDFVKQAFGATETLRTTGSAGGLHAEVMIGDSMLMIGGGKGVKEMPTSLHIYMPEADAVYQRALAAGGTSLHEPVDQPYGDREAGVKDPTGNYWWIATHKKGAGYIPEGLRTVTPFLHPVGAPKLIEFLRQAFAAEEISRFQSADGVIHHATVRIGDSMMEMGEAHGEWQPMPPAIYLYVEDVDETYERAIKAGATSMLSPTDQPYGDRSAWVNDAWGNTWYIATHKGVSSQQ